MISPSREKEFAVTDTFDTSDAVGAGIGSLALMLELLSRFSGKIKDDSTREFIQKKVSVLSGAFSKVDEGIWMSLITPLSVEEKKALTDLLTTFDRFREKESFRMVVINAPIPTKTIEVSDPNDKTGKKSILKTFPVEEFGDNDPRTKFLKELTTLVCDHQNSGAIKVRDMLRTHQLATENTFAKGVHDIWTSFEKDAKETVCLFFGAKEIKDITWSMIVKKIPRYEDEEINEGFLAYGIRKHFTWVIGVTIAIVLILTKAMFDSMKENPLLVLGGEALLIFLVLFFLGRYLRSKIKQFTKGGHHESI